MIRELPRPCPCLGPEWLGGLAERDARESLFALALGNLFRERAGGAPRVAARVAQRAIQERVAFAPEEGEVFAAPGIVWAARVGDCDDHARLVAATLGAVGIPTRIACLVDDEGNPTHAAAQAWLDGAWEWVETTVPAELGEHPDDAARRGGFTRRDITRRARVYRARAPEGMQTMSDEERKNDLAALAAAGFGVLSGPEDPSFRAAVRSFQSRFGLAADGRIGPLTRAKLGAVVASGEAGTTHTADVSDDDLRALADVAARLSAAGAVGVDPSAILSAWFAANQLRGGVLSGAALGSAGWRGTDDAFAAAPVEVQAPYLASYLEVVAPRMRAGRDVFVALVAPGAVGFDAAQLAAVGLRPDAMIALAQQQGGARWVELRRRLHELVASPSPVSNVVPAAAAPRRFTNAQAVETLLAAARAEGRELTRAAAEIGAAVAYGETLYGRGVSRGSSSGDAFAWAHLDQFGKWAQQGLLNWGALEYPAKYGETPPPWFADLGAVGRLGKDAGHPAGFFLFADDVRAARAFLRAWGKPDTIAAANAGDVTGVAAAMRRHGYYVGFHCGPGVKGKAGSPCKYEHATPEEALAANVRDYAALINSRLHDVRTKPNGGPLDTFVPGGAAVGGWGVGTLLAVGLALGGLSFAYLRG